MLAPLIRRQLLLSQASFSPALQNFQVREYGKTESRHKYKTPKMRMRCVERVFPPPGENIVNYVPGKRQLTLAEDMDVEKFMWKIGGDCYEYADQFESVQEILNTDAKTMKKDKGIPVVQRKYLMRKLLTLGMRELLKRGVLSFEYLERRTCTDVVKGRE